MWSYARLTQIAKHFGGPAGLVLTIATSGITLGASGLYAIQQLSKKATPPTPKDVATTEDANTDDNKGTLE